MKKILSLALVLVMVLGLAACGSNGSTASTTAAAATDAAAETTAAAESEAPAAASNIKVGFIFLHDENSTYDLNFMNAARQAIADLGLTEDQYLFRTNIPEGQECYNAAAELADAGCNIIFADSFGHEDYLIQAAQEFPDVQFCHATGTKAHTQGLANHHNAFAAIYQGRYMAGVAAGMKLGARSVCPSVTMDVTFTGSWYDETAEKEGANKLIQNGCVLISQHADSMGAPTACETAGVPNVSYNGSTIAACPNTFLVSSRIDWTPYYEMAIKAVMNGEEIPADWTGTLQTGSVVLTELNDAVAASGTAEKLEEVKAALEDGSLQVFDINTFTVNGEKVESFMADVDTDADYTPDTEVIENGAFQESTKRSAPYFTLQIDGINLLDQAY